MFSFSLLSEASLKKLFKAIDVDNSGFITAEDLQKIIKEASIPSYTLHMGSFNYHI